MKKISVIVLIVLILVVSVWFVSGFWDNTPQYEGGILITPQITAAPPVTGENPDSGLTNGPEDESGSGAGQDDDPAGNPGTDSGDSSPNIQEPPTTDPYPSAEPITQETEEELDERRAVMLFQVEVLFDSGNYEDALKLIRADRTLFNDETARLEEEIIAAMG